MNQGRSVPGPTIQATFQRDGGRGSVRSIVAEGDRSATLMGTVLGTIRGKCGPVYSGRREEDPQGESSLLSITRRYSKDIAGFARIPQKTRSPPVAAGLTMLGTGDFLRRQHGQADQGDAGAGKAST